AGYHSSHDGPFSDRVHLAARGDDLADSQQPERAGAAAAGAGAPPLAAAPASAAGRASECDARPALPEHPLELAPVSVASVVVERARVRVTDLFEQVLHPVDRVGIVAVEFLRLVALGGVVGVEALLRLGDL